MEDLKKLLDEIVNEMNQFKINADALKGIIEPFEVV